MQFLKILNIPPGPYYSWRRAWLLIALSMSACGFLSIGAVYGFHSFRQQAAREKGSCIQRIVQSGPQYCAFHTAFFAEALGLATDLPTFFYSFDSREAEKKLLETHLFKEVIVKKVKPNTLFIEYAPRCPIAYLGEYSNTALDEEGRLFPFTPFFTPKKLPLVFWGNELSEKQIEGGIWGKNLSEEKMTIVRNLFFLFPDVQLKSIDLATIHAPTLGQRQMIVVLERNKQKHILRLTPKNYLLEIQNYFKLLETGLLGKEEVCTVDLRLPQVAYFSHGEERT